MISSYNKETNMQPNEQTPPQLPPNPNIPPTQPIRRTIIQPLSSEDEIRQAAASSATPVRPSVPNITPTSTDSPATLDLNAQNEYAYESRLITEPLHPAPSPQAPYQTSNLVRPAPATPDQPKKKHGLAFGIAATLIVLGLASIAYTFLFSSRVTVADLVKTTTQNTTYLRPQQWKLAGANADLYGDLKGKEGKSTALVAIRESPATPLLINASDTVYAQLRSQLISRVSVSTVEGAFQQSSSPCQSDITFKADPDTKKTKTATGLFSLTASCTRNDGGFTLKMRTVVGIADGRPRMIAVAARDVDWTKNKDAFQAILDSPEQATN